MKHYMLIDGQVVCTENLMEWAMWMQNHSADCRIARDSIDDVLVSTVFIGLDHNFSNVGAPLLFETMIFVADESRSLWRYSTLMDAKAGHESVLKSVRTEVEMSKVASIDALVGAMCKVS